MTWSDALLVAWRSIGRRLGRAVLTVIAVALAAALLTALLIVADAARTRVLSQLSKGGPLAGIQVAAAAPNLAALGSDNPRPGSSRDLDDAALRRITAIAGVRSVVPIQTTPVLAVPSAPKGAAIPARRLAPIRETVAGVDLRQARGLPLALISGRLPAAGAQAEVVVTEGYLRRLGLERTAAARVVGTEVELGAPRIFGVGRSNRVFRGRWTRSLIVGVVAQQAVDAEVLAPAPVVRAAKAWTAASDDLSAFDVPTSKYAALFVVANGLDEVGPVRAAITRIGYSTSAPENLIETVQRYLHVVEIVLSGIGLIALLIAALGISNALLAAVRERRREIGVLKAIGARDRDVRRVFLLEASLLGLAGGVIGSIVGYAIARVMAAVVNGYLTDQGLPGVNAAFPIPVLVGAVLGSGALALLAGMIPAARAARLPARQAMGDG